MSTRSNVIIKAKPEDRVGMGNNRLTNLHHNGKPVVYIGNMAVKNQIIGVMDGERGVITSESLIPLFLNYNEGDKSILAFLNGEFWYTRPMVDIIPFKYDPATGEEIDWEHLKIAVSRELKNPTKDWR